MKKLLSFLFVTFNLCTFSYAQIIDGGFEGNIVDGIWTQSSTNWDSVICDVPSCGTGAFNDVGPYSGDRFVWLGGTTNGTMPEIGTIEQSINIPTGTTASIDIMVFIPQGETGIITDEEKVDFTMDGNIIQTITAFDSATYENYKLLSIDVSAYADGASHTFKMTGTQITNESFSVILDEASLHVDGVLVGILEGFKEEYVSVYPNPASNEIFISSNNEIIIDEVNIYNQLGKNVLYQQHINNSIDVSMLQPGIYILELSAKGEKQQFKLVKN